MSVTSVNINKSIQSISVYLVHRMSKEQRCSKEEALKKLLKTMTYELLQEFRIICGITRVYMEHGSRGGSWRY